MWVDMDQSGNWHLNDRDVFTSLHIQQPSTLGLRAMERSMADQHVGGLAPTLEDHAWLSIEWLRSHSAGETWNQKFDDMLSYAVKRGWLTGDGQGVLVHIES